MEYFLALESGVVRKGVSWKVKDFYKRNLCIGHAHKIFRKYTLEEVHSERGTGHWF